MSALKITLIQSRLYWEKPGDNLSMFEKKILAIPDETDLILLPEMFTTGFTMHASGLAEAPEGPSVQWMRRMAVKQKAVICGSLIIEENKKYFNRLIWMRPDGSFSHYDKRHLFRLAGEEMTYSPGNHQGIMHWKGWNIFPLVCYDLRFPVWSRRKKEMDFDLLLYVANWPEKRITAWKSLLPARAVENQAYVAGLNRTGDDGNGIYHSGESAVYNYQGELLSSFRPGEEMMETIALNLEDLREFREHFAFGKDADDFRIGT
ncbi:MAG: amidohydrolase [Bacteroidia bacterium]|nr:amidohydrolase [Bacteroidia bacterium]